jgi:hypothetical protein
VVYDALRPVAGKPAGTINRKMESEMKKILTSTFVLLTLLVSLGGCYIHPFHHGDRRDGDYRHDRDDRYDRGGEHYRGGGYHHYRDGGNYERR